MAADSLDLHLDGTTVRVDVATTFVERLRGLRFEQSGAMLFRFETPTRAVVDTLLVPEKLHLYVFDEDGRMIDSTTMKPNRLYRPAEHYCYLLESFDALPLRDGDHLPVGDEG